MSESPARNPVFQRLTRAQIDAIERSVPYHSLELRDGRIIPGTIPIERLRARFESFPIPERLGGKRALDIGAASGWNSFELERRGAEVVAVDCVEYEEFLAAKSLMQSKVDYRILDVDELSEEDLGTFDYVLFLGVLYHLRHPLLGLEKVCALTRGNGVACVESFVTDSDERSAACHLELYENDELGGQIDNWFGLTTRCLVAMCRSAGFARAELLYNDDRRAGVACRRRSGSPSTDLEPPRLAVAINNRHEDSYFSPGKDEYVCVHFHYGRDLTRDDVDIEVGGFGTPALVVAPTGPGRWQANVRVPPGLGPGDHDVTIRAQGSRPSKAVKITLLERGSARPIVTGLRTALRTAPVTKPAPSLIALENTMDRGAVFRGYRGERIRCIFESDHGELDVSSVEARIDGKPAGVLLVGRGAGTRWEVVLRLPKDIEAGPHEVRVRTFDSELSDGLGFEFEPEAGWIG